MPSSPFLIGVNFALDWLVINYGPAVSVDKLTFVGDFKNFKYFGATADILLSEETSVILNCYRITGNACVCVLYSFNAKGKK